MLSSSTWILFRLLILKVILKHYGFIRHAFLCDLSAIISVLLAGGRTCSSLTTDFETSTCNRCSHLIDTCLCVGGGELEDASLIMTSTSSLSSVRLWTLSESHDARDGPAGWQQMRPAVVLPCSLCKSIIFSEQQRAKRSLCLQQPTMPCLKICPAVACRFSSL